MIPSQHRDASRPVVPAGAETRVSIERIPPTMPDRRTVGLRREAGDESAARATVCGSATKPLGGGDSTHFSLGGLAFGDAEALGANGRYQIDQEFTRGSMGAIYRGFDAHLGREVAFKFLLEEHRNNTKLRDRFLQEARITARLQHAGVVPVYDLHRVAGNGLFFTMMFVHGASLKELLRKRPTPATDLPRFLTVFEKICQTMAYAHAQGVIHRDLKPSNFVVGDFGVVRVMDWGLAKVLRERPAAVEAMSRPRAGTARSADWADGTGSTSDDSRGGAMGTLAYMAPEQAQGLTELVDERADVFGLGAVLCEILTGWPPYVGSTLDHLFQMARTAELGDAMERLDRCLADPSLVRLAKHCLSPRPGDRPRDAGEVAPIMTAQLESELQRTALDMVRFFELSQDLFCLANLDGYFQRVNDNFPKILGFTKSDLMARPFLEFVHPDDLAPTLIQMDKLARGLPVVCFKNRYRDSSGQYHWFEWTAKSLPEEKLIFAVARPEMSAAQAIPT